MDATRQHALRMNTLLQRHTLQICRKKYKKHFANAQRAVFVEQVCREAGYEPPRITTLYELSLGD
jgi:hypothetical protein